jgi:hypothetical protein
MFSGAHFDTSGVRMNLGSNSSSSFGVAPFAYSVLPRPKMPASIASISERSVGKVAHRCVRASRSAGRRLLASRAFDSRLHQPLILVSGWPSRQSSHRIRRVDPSGSQSPGRSTGGAAKPPRIISIATTASVGTRGFEPCSSNDAPALSLFIFAPVRTRLARAASKNFKGKEVS